MKNKKNNIPDRPPRHRGSSIHVDLGQQLSTALSQLKLPVVPFSSAANVDNEQILLESCCGKLFTGNVFLKHKQSGDPSIVRLKKLD